MATVLQRLTWRTGLLVSFESVLLLSTILIAAWARLGEDSLEAHRLPRLIAKGALITGVCQMCLYYAELYDFRVVADRRELFVRILQALGAASLILALLYYWFPALVIGRGV